MNAVRSWDVKKVAEKNSTETVLPKEGTRSFQGKKKEKCGEGKKRAVVLKAQCVRT